MASALLSSSSSSAVVLKQQHLVLSRHGSSSIVSYSRIHPLVCRATKEGDSDQAAATSPVEKKVEAASPVTPIQTPPQPKKPETSFLDLFAFSGPVPEAVNGRLAMLGFTAALGVELASGRGLLGQLDNGGSSYFVGAALLFTLASLVPLFQGVSIEKASGGIGGVFTSKAERWNGRAAMLGLVALGITEFVKGSPLI
ncbi:LHC-related protein [Selaginella moellendorffii]|uniref:LHC-related protein n=1 Tax=Selaginella moellendorffii TaxID=88036 RepID=D8S0K0_SELML|nr:early light-induced protein 1, chloroplastic [Selaginella moellendorffii]EFJ21942.1 LHC-related protein [Selaginella moellendorffii]|eukprot:XP_002976832.1 early light-induced protein 1, chloroplastic [Selaginella moellendorffii]